VDTLDRGDLWAMKLLRLATLALLAVCPLSGCRTAGVGELARPSPAPTASSASVAALLAEHNRNAERIQVIWARPSLTVTSKGERPYGLSGRMALEQPRNFKLELSHTGGTVGDLGSNDTEFWFWIKNSDKTQRAIYYCNYDEADANPQAVTFQPDWIKEAMGLRVIPEEEASEITVTSGEAGKIVLTHRPRKTSGKFYTRVTILDRTTHQILEHRLLSGDQKTLLARADVPEGYMQITPATGGGDEAVLIPKRLKLYWVQQGLEIDAMFRDVKINEPIKQSSREALFVEPQLGKAYPRINLAERPTGTTGAGTTTLRETRPAPPSSVRLREPTAIEGPEAARDEPSVPLNLSGEGPTVPSLTTGVVGARYPSAVEPDYQRPDGSTRGWRAASGPGLVLE
jgi:hypothetical protein